MDGFMISKLNLMWFMLMFAVIPMNNIYPTNHRSPSSGALAKRKLHIRLPHSHQLRLPFSDRMHQDTCIVRLLSQSHRRTESIN